MRYFMRRGTFLGGNFLHSGMRSTMLKLRILMRIRKSSVNAYGLLLEMRANRRRSRFFKSKEEMRDDIYNTIKSLEKSGLIKASQKTENGRVKQYYTITTKGRAAVKSAKKLFAMHLKELTSIFG